MVPDVRRHPPVPAPKRGRGLGGPCGPQGQKPRQQDPRCPLRCAVASGHHNTANDAQKGRGNSTSPGASCAPITLCHARPRFVVDWARRAKGGVARAARGSPPKHSRSQPALPASHAIDSSTTDTHANPRGAVCLQHLSVVVVACTVVVVACTVGVVACTVGVVACTVGAVACTVGVVACTVVVVACTVVVVACTIGVEGYLGTNTSARANAHTFFALPLHQDTCTRTEGPVRSLLGLSTEAHRKIPCEPISTPPQTKHNKQHQ